MARARRLVRNSGRHVAGWWGGDESTAVGTPDLLSGSPLTLLG